MIPNDFKSKIFPTKKFSASTRTNVICYTKQKNEGAKKSRFEFYEDLNRKVVHDETKIKTEISIEYFKYQNPSFLLRDLFNSSGIKMRKL